jgi:hypothetical protein
MAAAVLEIPYLDPVIPQKKTDLLRPGHIDMKVCKKGSKTWPSHFNFIITYQGTSFLEVLLFSDPKNSKS